MVIVVHFKVAVAAVRTSLCALEVMRASMVAHDETGVSINIDAVWVVCVTGSTYNWHCLKPLALRMKLQFAPTSNKLGSYISGSCLQIVSWPERKRCLYFYIDNWFMN